VAERIITAWLDANAKPPSRPGKGPAWTLANAGARELNWLVHAPLILSGNDKRLRSRVLGAITEGARWLDKNVHRAEDLLAAIAGWCGIVAAGLLLPEGKPRRLYGEAGLIRALGDLMGDDGGVLSRSPLGQMEAIALLVTLRACYRATRRDPPEVLDNLIAVLVPPLLAMTHGDGSIGSWQGGWAIDAAEIAALVDASGVRTRPLRDVRQWGYQRVVAQKSVLLFDAAPPPLARYARNGCASTLAFELSHNGQRVVVNCGGSSCAGGLVPVRLEQGLRATAAHSTLVLDDANSTAVLINGRIGSGGLRGRHRPAHARGRFGRPSGKPGRHQGCARHPARGQPQRLYRTLWPDPPPHPHPARRRPRAARRGPARAHGSQGQARQGRLRHPLPSRPEYRRRPVGRREGRWDCAA
jgi:uncharacterized heparinase superfamily protein